MARICALCRQPVGGKGEDHVCLDDDLDPEDGPEDAAA